MKKEAHLGSISITSFSHGGNTVKAKGGSISFPVSYENERDGYVVEDTDLGIYAFSKTKQGLSRILKQELEFSWGMYALKPNKQLTGKIWVNSKNGLEIKKNLLKTFKEQI